MATTAVVSPKSDTFRPIASPWHTVALLVLQTAIVLRGIYRADAMHALANASRVALYQRTILMEWALFGLVIFGVWRQGAPLTTVLGERWRSARQFFTDVGLGIAFLFAAILLQSVVASVLHGEGGEKATQFLLPQGRAELIWWVFLSLSAGICEETLFRGYFQRQFMAFTKSAPLGILLSAMIFGAAHGYQGLRQAISIGLLGVMGGMLAYWRKTVRPGMFEHTLQDVLGGFVRH
jgi:CAAX protease family protein